MPQTHNTTPAEQPSLAWKWGMDCHEFISRMDASHGSENPLGLRFEINHNFLNAVRAMDDNIFDTVLRSLRSAPITMVAFFVGFDGLAQRGDNFCCGRLMILFGVLGQLSTLETFWFYSDVADMFNVLIQALKCLRSVSCIDIYGFRTSDPWLTTELASALESHPSLEEIGLFVTTKFYRSVLPKLRTIPTLRKVVLYPITDLLTTDHSFGEEDRQALADLVASNSPLEVDLTGLGFASPTAHAWLCQTLTRARIHGLSLAIHIKDEDVESICKALEQSRVTSLRLHRYLADTQNRFLSDSLDILPILVERFPAMPRLEELEVSCQFGQEDLSIAVIRAAARCRRLKRLHIRLLDHPPLMDEVLAGFMAANVSLENITITYEVSTSDLHLPSTLRLPVVLNMVQSRFFTCDICIKNSADPVTNYFAMNIATVVRLNRAGRAYVKFAPGDKVRGCRLLEEVMDDLDCIYFHLRENPTLCEHTTEP